MQSIPKVLFAGFIATLCACNSGSSMVPAGQQCPSGYGPIPKSAGPNQKPVPMKPGQNNKDTPIENQMPPGRYTYNFADIIYQDKDGVTRPLQIQLHDAADGTGLSTTQSVYCTRNAKSTMNVPVTEVDAVTDVVVCPDFTQVVKTRHYKFSITNGTPEFTGPTPTGLCFDSVDSTKLDPLLLKNSGADYEVRTANTLKDGSGSFLMAVRMLYRGFTDAELAPGGIDECAAVKMCKPTPAPKAQAAKK
ncbi:MAG: hypothetical protein ACXVA9_01315 [Bdellovibrionales bacterium]